VICLLFGPPGCGKGTQARLLSHWLGIPSVSTGSLLRAAADEPTPAGRAFKTHLADGGFAADEVVNDLIRQRLEDGPPALILDGYPRTLGQAIYFDRLLAMLGVPSPVAIHLGVDAEVLVNRLSERRHCPRCERAYNLRMQPPARAALCDDCDAPLARRDDDAPATVRRRLEIYERITAPVLQHYKSGHFFDFNGDQAAPMLFAEMQLALGFERAPRAGL
jgi:adenylate kinase